MEENIFIKHAHLYLTELFEFFQSPTKYEDLDLDLQDDVLYITLPNLRQYVINKHTPSMQIWLSSPVSGAGYYSYNNDSEQWLNKHGTLLFDLLLQELKPYE